MIPHRKAYDIFIAFCLEIYTIGQGKFRIINVEKRENFLADVVYGTVMMKPLKMTWARHRTGTPEFKKVSEVSKGALHAGTALPAGG